MSTLPARPAARYGRRPSPRRTRIMLAVTGAVFLVVSVVVGASIAHQPVRYEAVSYRHVDDRHISLTFQVTMRPGTTARCSLEALDATRGQVGFLQVDVPAQAGTTSSHRADIATQGAAVSATVTSCDPT